MYYRRERASIRSGFLSTSVLDYAPRMIEPTETEWRIRELIWKKFTIETSVEAEDLVAEYLEELGFPGAEITDQVPLTEEEMKQMYVDVPLIPEGETETAQVSIYLDADHDEAQIEELKRQVAEELDRMETYTSVGSKKITVTETEDDATWQENWKQYYQPFRLGEDIVIQPVWTEYEDIRPEDKVVRISSVMAFGTGTHETTKLCIGQLRKYLSEGQSVFDVGCGSGILAILSVLLGAGYVHGLDIDPQAVLSSRENAEANGLTSDRIAFSCGNLLAGNVIGAMNEEERERFGKAGVKVMDEEEQEAYKKASLGSGIAAVNPVQLVDLALGEEDTVPARTYDIVVANILADVIIPLSAVIPQYLVPGGIFITSGIMEDRAEDVRNAMKENGFTILDTVQMGEWVSVVATTGR